MNYDPNDAARSWPGLPPERRVSADEVTKLIRDSISQALDEAVDSNTVIAKAWCEANKSDYISHKVGDDGVLNISAMSWGSVYSVTVKGTVSV